MIITCPSCAAEYNVPATLAPGRIVRCAKCGGEWAPVPAPVAEPQPAPPPPVVAAVPVLVPVPVPVTVPVPQPEPPAPSPAAPLPTPATPLLTAWRQAPRAWALLAAWLASGVVIAAAVAAALVFRTPIMQAWPPSQRVYGVLGLRPAASPNLQGDVVK